MRIIKRLVVLLLAGTIFINFGCTSLNSFGLAGRSGAGADGDNGDTIALVLGWNLDIDRDDITVTITDSLGVETTYLPGDTRVRAMLNSYPDPVSKLVVGGETSQFIDGIAVPIYKLTIDGNITSGDPDWSTKILFLDLPIGMESGPATINVSAGGFSLTAGDENDPVVEILPGEGVPNDFSALEIGVTDAHLKSLERADHNTITFSTTLDPYDPVNIPHAIQLDLTHDPEVGVPYVANTRGDVKSIFWTNLSDSSIRVIIMPAQGQTLEEFVDFRFYVAGEITGLAVDQSDVTGYDINGNVVPGLFASVN